MKKLVATIAAACVLLALCACGRKSAASTGAAGSASASAPGQSTSQPAAPTAQPSQAGAASGSEALSAPTPEPAAEEPAAAEPADLVDGMRPEFKEAMDSYEAFYDDYCDFMAKYTESPSDLALLSEYAVMLTKLEVMNEKFEAWESDDLNNAELKYYIEVNSRISQKLLDVAQ